MLKPRETIGTFYLFKGEFEEARLAYERSLAIEPSVATLTNLAGLYQRDGNLEKAIYMLERATSMDGASFQTWNALTHAYKMANRPNDSQIAAHEAVGLAESALEASPTNIRAVLGLASAKGATGNTTEATELALQAVDMDPSDPHTAASAAAILAENGNTTNAVRLACQALGLGLSRDLFNSIPSLKERLERPSACYEPTNIR